MAQYVAVVRGDGDGGGAEIGRGDEGEPEDDEGEDDPALGRAADEAAVGDALLHVVGPGLAFDGAVAVAAVALVSVVEDAFDGVGLEPGAAVEPALTGPEAVAEPELVFDVVEAEPVCGLGFELAPV